MWVPFPLAIVSHYGLSARTQTPYSENNPLNLRGITGPATAPQFAIEELTVDASGSFNNPFDSSQVSLDAEVTGPTGMSYSLPGYLNRTYNRSLTGGQESMEPTGAATWKLRISPTEVGHYHVLVTFRDHGGSKSGQFNFDCIPGTHHGSVRVSKSDHRYFEFADGASYFPVGENLAWAGGAGSFDYDRWLGKLGRCGANLISVWLGPTWSTFSLERPGDPSEGRGAGMIDLAASSRLDHVFQVAQAQNIAIKVCLDSAEELQIRGEHPGWTTNPLNKDNGGPLRVWTDFWSNPAAAKIYDDRIRYLIARYSANSNLFAWELWHDVDTTPEYDADVVRSWHMKTAKELNAKDPYHHLITTSFAASNADRDTYLLHDIDFSESHVFSGQLVGVLGDILQRRQEWAKPCLISEVAADRESPHNADDPTGIQMHDALWMSTVTGSAGASMAWYWEKLVDQNDLYSLFSSTTNWVKDVDFPHEAFRVTMGKITDASSNVWLLTGNDLALGWIQPKGRSWKAVILEHHSTPMNPPAVLSIQDLASGIWKVEFWDTWRGAPMGLTLAHVGLDGKASIHLPSFSKDLAFKMKLTKT